VPFILGGIALLVLITAGVLAASDVISEPPPPPRGVCTLVTQRILPDYCANSCIGPVPNGCVATTRPYAVFFKQAATCDAGVLCPSSN
jgi:hypothetical protein